MGVAMHLLLSVALAVAGCAGDPAPRLDASGWQRWSAAPVGCVVERDPMPERHELAWQPCATGGCDQVDAPWAAGSGWGFGGLLSAAVDDRGRVVLAISRSPERGVWESIVFRDERGVAALLVTVPDARCVAGGPWLGPDGRAAIAIATLDPGLAVVATGAIDQLALDPVVTSLGGGAVLDVVTVAATRVAVWQPHGFLVIERDGTSWRPRADGLRTPGPPVDAGDQLAFIAGADGRDAIWRTDPDTTAPWYAEPDAALGPLVGDGTSLAWVRRGHEPAGVEVWAAPVAPMLAPHRIAAVTGDAPAIAIGDGRLAIRTGDREIQVHRLDGGGVTTLVPPPQLAFAGGARFAVIAGNTIVVKAYPAGAWANDVRALLRWRLGKIEPRVASP